MSLVSLADGKKLAETGFINPQRAAALGSDVLSRMRNAANPRTGARMRSMLLASIRHGAEALFEKTKLDDTTHTGGVPVVIAGNTTMLHIFSGLDTASMLKAPFIPADMSMRREWLKMENTSEEPGQGTGMPVTLFPCISAFVGGDIVAGIFALDLLEKKAPVLFLDLGTNGEMALFTGEKLYVTSVAAGPAFEGGNISIGMAAVDGAISRVNIRRGFCRVETVGGKPAKGICGSGLFDAVAQMFADGIIDSHGTLSERYIEDGFPVYMRDASHRLILTQDDIRAFQTAKAAVAAGAEALLCTAGVSVEEVAEVCIAGNFGEYLDPASAKTVGLLPREMFDKMRSVGNTSLLGAEKLLAHPEDKEIVEKITEVAIPLDLAGDELFKTRFIERMEI